MKYKLQNYDETEGWLTVASSNDFQDSKSNLREIHKHDEKDPWRIIDKQGIVLYTTHPNLE